MKELTLQERNEAIALFMGATLSTEWTDEPTYFYGKDKVPTIHSSYNWTVEQMLYDYSYDWLMPVVEKIEKQDNIITKIESLRTVGGDLSHKSAIHNLSIYGTSCIAYGESNSKIEAVFLAVSDFCIVYNQSNKQ